MRLFGADLSLANALPVVGRELRAESRRPINYWLRVLAAAVMVGVFVGFASSTEVGASRLGAALFAVLQRTLSLCTWIIAPMMTADCVSREKREGTLGLLFLTPLTVLDLMMAKAMTQVLRAATLVLASVPLLVLPFVLGGIELQEALVAVAKVANALLLGIAAGLYASARGGSAIQVMVMAEGYAVLLAMASGISQFVFGIAPFVFFECARLAMASGISHFVFSVMSRSSFWVLAWRLGTSVGFTLVVFPMVIKASVQLLRETWHQDSAAPEQPKWVAVFSGSESWRTIFQWERGRTLDHNPIVWLQEYSWTARLTKWGWFLAVLVAGFFLLVGFPGCQPQLTTVLSLGVAFSAAGSFRRERQSGLLELLPVTPLLVRQLIAGRLWGICSHFFPAWLVLALFWDADRLLNSKEFHANPFALVFPNPLAFVALMVVGLYLSLWRLNFLAAWLLGWALAFLLPAICTVALSRLEGIRPLTIVALTSAFQAALAAASWLLLRRDLEQRRFVKAEAM